MSNERGTNGAAIRRLLGVWLVTVALQMTPAHDADAQAVSPGVAQPNTKTQKPPLHGRKWIAITGKPLAATAGARIFERGGNAVDAACAMLAATSTMWDVLSWGGETQALIYDPRTRKVVAINGLGVAPTGATPGVLPQPGAQIPTGIRSARRSHAGNAGRAVADARRVRNAVARRRAGTGHRARGWLSDRSGDRQLDRAQQGQARAVAVLAHDHAAASRAAARGTGRRRDLSSTRSRRDAAQARRGRSRRAQEREITPGGDSRGARAVLPRRHCRGIRARRAGTGWPDHARGSRELEAAHRGARHHELSWHRRLQARCLDPGTRAAAVAEPARGLRPARARLQQRPVHPPALPGDESRLCRSGFLLRRPRFSAGRAATGTAVEGLRTTTRGDDRSRSQRRTRGTR